MRLRSGSFLQERYEILDHIGSGGMSDVYKARDRKLNRLVGIKVLKEEFCDDREFVGKFRMEAQAAAGLAHPNVVNVFDVVDDINIHFIVMELVEGITLKNYITRKGTLDVKETIGIAIQISQGIGAAHDQHIVHRDIKPQNIIISSAGKVKVADFGIARATSSNSLSSEAMGSVHYISPEQARGETSDERSDIYSLGISMFEMITGKLPFEGDTPVSTALAQIEQDMPLPSSYNSSCSVALEQIILKCCQKKPERRYQSVRDLIADLRYALLPGKKSIETDISSDSHTRILTQEELAEINVRTKQKNKTKKSSADDEDSAMDKVIAVAGVVLAVAIVFAVVYVALRYVGVFNKSAEETEIESVLADDELKDTQTLVPDVHGLSYELAEQKLADYTLQIKVQEYQSNDDYEKNQVISQSPSAEEIVDKYSTIYVVLSVGTNSVDLSNLALVGADTNSARTQLLDIGLDVKLQEEFDENTPAGIVIGVSPMNPEKGGAVTLIVSKGKEIPMAQVPSIIGLSEEDAIGLLSDSGLVPGSATGANSDTVPAGSVISQAILPDTEIEPGAEVSYTVSLGPEIVEPQQYVGSIKTSYDMADLIGPGSSISEVSIMIRLHQLVNGEDIYTILMDPRAVRGDTILPIKFDYIEGAEGVDQGDVEVVKADTGEVVRSYSIEFFKQ